MQKRKYVKPILETEEFLPQEYIAVCEDFSWVRSGMCWEYKEDPKVDFSGKYEFSKWELEHPLGGTDLFNGAMVEKISGTVTRGPIECQFIDSDDNPFDGKYSPGHTCEYGYYYEIQTKEGKQSFFSPNKSSAGINPNAS